MKNRNYSSASYKKWLLLPVGINGEKGKEES